RRRCGAMSACEKRLDQVTERPAPCLKVCRCYRDLLTTYVQAPWQRCALAETSWISPYHHHLVRGWSSTAGGGQQFRQAEPTSAMKSEVAKCKVINVAAYAANRRKPPFVPAHSAITNQRASRRQENGR